MFDIMKISRKIKDARIARNMTQMNLAEEMDVSFQAVSSWERGNSMPDISKLEQLCEVLQISIDELLEGSSVLPSEELKSKMEHTLEKQENIDLSALTSIAPFLHESDLIEFVERANVKSIREVVCIAPFLDEKYLGKLAMRAVEVEPEHIQSVAPFLNEETLNKLVIKLVESGKADMVKGLYPFLSRKTLKLIAEELVNK